MLFAEMSGGEIGAWAVAASVVIAAVVAAWISLRKSKVETDQTVRNNAIAEWQTIVEKLQKSHDSCLCLVKEQDQKIVTMRDEQGKRIDAMQAKIDALHNELSALRLQVTSRETERVEQRGEIRNLEKKVAEVAKPDVAAIADAVVPKIVEALAAAPLQPAGPDAPPVKIEIVPASKPLPVKETPG